MPPRRSSLSSPFLSPPVLIILLPIIALIFLFFAVPSFLSVTSHLLRPTSVKKSWDSFNIFLVVFAILCGVFARKNDDELSPADEEVIRTVAYEKTTEQDRYVSQQWSGFSERKIYDIPPIRLQSPAAGVGRLRRNSSSYPDLRQESSWEIGTDRYQFRFFDDFEIDKFRSPMRDQLPADHPKQRERAEEEVDVKEIPVDTFENRSTSSPQPAPKSPVPPPPPPPPPPAAARPKPRRAYQTVPRKKKGENASEVNAAEFTRTRSPPVSPPPPPPAPSVQMRSEHKHGKSERRKSNVKREIAMVWASVLSHQRIKRKKKQRTKRSNHIHDYDNVHSPTESPNNTTPPPPPPPPPPSVFHSLFKKGLGKSKKVHSVPTPPPPPPPPSLTPSKRWTKRKSQIPPPPPPPAPPTPPPEPLRRRNVGRPPLPTRASNIKDETINSGNQSPLIPIPPPPPPPPPPFRMPEMKFVVRGDFVKIWSNQSSRCSSPEPEDIDGASTKEESEINTNPVTDNSDRGGPVFCASPDVNVKAATFIARLRREWKLEKLNSMKEKRHLGLDPGPI